MGTAKTQIQQAPAKSTEIVTSDKKPPKREQRAAPIFTQRFATPLIPPSGSPNSATKSQLATTVQRSNHVQLANNLQRQVGNNRMANLLDGAQAKLAVSTPGDRYEQEADEVAARVVSGQKVARISRIAAGGHTSSVNKQIEKEEGEKKQTLDCEMPSQEQKAEDPQILLLQRKSLENAKTLTTEAQQVKSTSKTNAKSQVQTKIASSQTGSLDDADMEARIKVPSAGRPLPEGVRREIGTSLGVDFSNVRVHDTAADKSSAKALNAQAFTYRNHIWMGPSASVSDHRLMAHELTHVVQQTGGRSLAKQSGASISHAMQNKKPNNSSSLPSRLVVARQEEPRPPSARERLFHVLFHKWQKRNAAGQVYAAAKLVTPVWTFDPKNTLGNGKEIHEAQQEALEKLVSVVRNASPSYRKKIPKGTVYLVATNKSSAESGELLQNIANLYNWKIHTFYPVLPSKQLSGRSAVDTAYKPPGLASQLRFGFESTFAPKSSKAKRSQSKKERISTPKTRGDYVSEKNVRRPSEKKGSETRIETPSPTVPKSKAPRAGDIQAPSGGEISSRKAKQDAAALLKAFQGAGTKEAVVHRILNQAPRVVRAITAAYNTHYNIHTGKGLLADLKYEFDDFGGKDEWLLIVGQLKRAGITVPGVTVSFRRHDPMARTRIAAKPNVHSAVPGTKITYEVVRGPEYHASGSYYSYQWYVINDQLMSRILGKPAVVDLGSSYKADAIAVFVGNHKIVCRVIYHPVGEPTRKPVFYEFPQTVVPEGQLAADALKAAPVGADPAKELEVLEAFLKVLLSAEKRADTGRLDPKVKESYEKQIAAMKKRLAGTASKKRYPIKAVHVDREKGRVSPLKVFIAKKYSTTNWETWTLVDITNPMSRRLSGEYTGSGKNAGEAINAAIRDWDSDNRYPTGRIKLKVDDKVAGTAIIQEFQTDGASFWDSISEFFSEVGFWAGIGAISVGIVTAVAPVPGSRVVSALIWTSIVASSAAAVINIAQRHSEDMSSGIEDTMDVLTIVGNVLAGAWMKGAKVIVGKKGGSKIVKGILIGQIATDGMQGIIISVELIGKYDEIMKIRDPKKRTDALMELFRSAAAASLMLFISAKSTKGDLDKLGPSKAKMKIWEKFEPITDGNFKKKLSEFRGNDDVFPNPGLSGSEGQLFLSPKYPARALKRWWKSQLYRMTRSIQLLIEARNGVNGNPTLAKDIEVVKIHQQGPDWIVRDFDPKTVELSAVLDRSAVAREKLKRILQVLRRMRNKNLGMRKLQSRLSTVSANIHWSEAKQKLIVIDLQ